MNRYDYYTRCACVDEQEWLTEELYYPERDSRHYDWDDWDDYPDDDMWTDWDDCDDDWDGDSEEDDSEEDD